MKQSYLPLLLTLLLPLVACNSKSSTISAPKPTTLPDQPTDAMTAPTSATPASSFDYYLLTLSWSPEYCHSHPSDIQCIDHDTFVLHGLWPERNGGTYPENCSTAPGPADPSQYKDIYPDLGLLTHEWKTHGTCSGLAPDTFFGDARKAFQSIKLPPELTQLKAQASMPPAQILSAFTKANPQLSTQDMTLSCGSNYLTSVQVCLDKSTFKPTACGAIKTCKANTVRIPAP